MKGIFTLKTSADLLQKLDHDFCLIKEKPDNPYAAFNFFVTAEHMRDWHYPGDRESQKQLVDSEVLLQICSHIANGAKHFEINPNRHKSVSNTVKKSAYGGGALPKGSFPIGALPKGAVPGKWADELYVELSGEASELFGDRIGVVSLAEKIIIYWRKQLKH